jgi:hypothetical protein
MRLMAGRKEIEMGTYRKNPRYNVISLRVSDDTYNDFRQMASKNDLSISRLMRQVMDNFTRCLEPSAGMKEN